MRPFQSRWRLLGVQGKQDCEPPQPGPVSGYLRPELGWRGGSWSIRLPRCQQPALEAGVRQLSWPNWLGNDKCFDNVPQLKSRILPLCMIIWFQIVNIVRFGDDRLILDDASVVKPRKGWLKEQSANMYPRLLLRCWAFCVNLLVCNTYLLFVFVSCHPSVVFME